MKQRGLYAVIAAGGAVGLIASFLQTLEKLVLLQNKDAILPCNINSVFNCSAVLNAWQSAVFGFPNSLLCIVLFTIVLSIGTVGVATNPLPKSIRITLQILALGMFGFALWFMWQSTFVIGALCIFCLVCLAGLLMANWALLRVNAKDLPIGKYASAILQKAIKKDYDILVWAGIAAVVVATMILRFM